MMAYSNPFTQSFPSPSSMYLKSGGMGGMPYHMGLGSLGMGLDPMHGQYGNPSKLTIKTTDAHFCAIPMAAERPARPTTPPPFPPLI